MFKRFIDVALVLYILYMIGKLLIDLERLSHPIAYVKTGLGLLSSPVYISSAAWYGWICGWFIAILPVLAFGLAVRLMIK